MLPEEASAEAAPEGTTTVADVTTQETPVVETKETVAKEPVLNEQQKRAALKVSLDAVFAKHEGKNSEAPKDGAEAKPEVKTDVKPGDVKKADEPVAKDQTAKEPEGGHPMPTSWAADKKATWDAMLPEARTQVAQRELEFSRKLSQQGQALKSWEPFKSINTEFKPFFDKIGMKPHEAIKNLLEYNTYLLDKPETAIRDLAQTLKVDLRKLVGADPLDADLGLDAPGGKPNPEVESLKATVAELKNQLGKVTTNLTAKDQQAIENSNSERLSAFDTFVKDKDATELAAVESEFEALITSIRRSNPQMPHADVLAKAYDQAAYANPVTRKARIDKEAKAAEVTKVENAKKAAATAKNAAAVNVKSSPPDKSGNFKSLRDAQEAVWSKHQQNA